MVDVFAVMRTLRLALYFCIGLLLGALPVLSHAETIAATPTAQIPRPVLGWGQYPTGSCDATGCPSDPDAAGAAFCASYSPPRDYTGKSSTAYGWYVTCSGGAATGIMEAFDACPAGYTVGAGGAVCNPTAPYSCPAGQGWTLDGNQCTRPDCPAGTTRQADGTCSQPCQNTGVAESGYYDDPPPNLQCINGCNARFSGASPVASRVVGGQRKLFALGAYVYSGLGQDDSCTAGRTNGASGALPTEYCAPGQVQGEINGRVICTTPDGTNATKGPDGQPEKKPGAAHTTEETIQNADGSTTKKTVRVNPDGSVTTTTETTFPDGRKTKQETTEGEEEKKSFCEENPSISICQEKTVEGGTLCASPPACTGDAVECAVVRQVWETRCQAEKIKEGLGDADGVEAVADVLNVNISGAAAEAGLNGSKDKNVSSMWASNLGNHLGIGPSACPQLPDVALPHGGTLSFATANSLVCGYGDIMRWLLRVVALSFVFMLISRGVT